MTCCSCVATCCCCDLLPSQHSVVVTCCGHNVVLLRSIAAATLCCCDLLPSRQCVVVTCSCCAGITFSYADSLLWEYKDSIVRNTFGGKVEQYKFASAKSAVFFPESDAWNPMRWWVAAYCWLNPCVEMWPCVGESLRAGVWHPEIRMSQINWNRVYWIKSIEILLFLRNFP